MSNNNIYNSRLTKIYIEYIKKYYPHINIKEILEYAGMNQYQINDPGHWFTQEQVDKFNYILVKKTNDPDISYKVGKYAASVEHLSIIKRYSLSFISPLLSYVLLGKIYPFFSKGVSIKTKKVKNNMVEVISNPLPGVIEKRYQCKNRIGMLEALGKIFTNEFAKVDHPECVHDGGQYCKYIISWKEPKYYKLKRFKNYTFILFIILLLASLIIFDFNKIFLILTFGLFIFLLISFFQNYLENQELKNMIQHQGDMAKRLIDEMDRRYNNALLIHEIGNAILTISEKDRLFSRLTELMRNSLDFDRCIILLAYKDKSRLKYISGYGYTKEEEEVLKNIEFHLDKERSKGIFVRAYKEKKPFIINNIEEMKKEFSPRSQMLIEQMDVKSLICVPMVYKDEPLGIIAVDTKKTGKSLTVSDMNLLMGIASQTALGIVNANAIKKIKESEERYRELVEGANSVIMRVNLEGRINFINGFGLRCFNYKEEEIINKTIYETILSKDDETKKEFSDILKNVSSFQNSYIVKEIKNIRKGGDPVWIAWTFRPIVSKGEVIKEILCIGNDVTELKKSHEEKRTLELQLIQAQKMEAIGTLAGGIAHDFNNILQGIYGFTQILMLDKEENDPELKYLKEIEKAVERASDLIKRILIFSRRVKSELIPLHLNNEVLQTRKMLERIIPKMISIELRLSPDLSLIKGDRAQIEQVIINLATNSRDAMPDGGKLLIETQNFTMDKTFCEKNKGAKPGDYVLLKVSDTGQGIDPEVKDRIFEPFFTTKEAGKGTGLGLPMIYGIVKNHGGYIKCESEKGKGTTFSIYFPAIISEDIIKGEKGREQKFMKKGVLDTILIVDDEEDILNFTKEILEKTGYKTFVASDGESAIQVYEKHKDKIDLIILDLIMPGMSGKRCLEEIIKLNPNAKILITTGYLETQELLSERRWNIKGYLSKPYSVNQLLKKISEINI